MNQKHTFKWSSAGRSHVGMVRAINEDACLVMPEIGLWVVADGMGGHEAGDIASQMVIETLQETPPPRGWPDFLDSVRQGLRKVNQRLRQESAQRYQNRTIGSTVVVLLIHATQCACLWWEIAASIDCETISLNNSPAITAMYRNWWIRA